MKPEKILPRLSDDEHIFSRVSARFNFADRSRGARLSGYGLSRTSLGPNWKHWTMDISVRSSMKVAAKCDKCHDLQTLVSWPITECKLRLVKSGHALQSVVDIGHPPLFFWKGTCGTTSRVWQNFSRPTWTTSARHWQNHNLHLFSTHTSCVCGRKLLWVPCVIGDTNSRFLC